MELLPVVHVRDETPVALTPKGLVPMDAPYADGGRQLVPLLRHMFARFGGLYLVDHGKGRMADTHHNLLQKLAKQQVLAWVDTEAITLEDIMDLFVSGAERVTVRMDEVRHGELEDILSLVEGEVYLGYPAQDDRELQRWLRDAPPHHFLEAGAAGVVAVDQAGAASGVPFDRKRVESLVGSLPAGTPAVVVTGARAAQELVPYEDLGVEAVAVGNHLFDDLSGFAAQAKTWRDARPGDGATETSARGNRATDDAANASAAVSFAGASAPFEGIVPHLPDPEQFPDEDGDDTR